MSSWNNYEPQPVINDYGYCIDEVIEALKERKEHGKAKYGVYLQPFNGRRVVIDQTQELMDYLIYSVQMRQEFDFYYRLLEATSEYYLTGKMDKLEELRTEVIKVYKMMEKLFEKE
jgi:hypothetical protein